MVRDRRVSSYDFFPTLLDYLGVPAPKGGRRPGQSYTRLFHGDPRDWRSRVFFEYEYVRGIRTRNLKYVERTREWPGELYDLEADPGEKRNLIADPAYQKALAALRTEVAGFFRKAGAPPIEEWRTTTHQHLTEYKAVQR